MKLAHAQAIVDFVVREASGPVSIFVADSHGELADPVERASFDPFFTFFLGGVAVFEGESQVGAVGVSGLPGEVDDALARQAVEAAGLSV